MADFKLKSIPRRRAKRCYELAGGAMLASPGDTYHTGRRLGRRTRLAHGVIRPLPSRPDIDVPHAWIERGGEVWDPVHNQWMSAETFSLLFRPEVGHRYSGKEAARLLLERGYWGVWDDFPPHYWVAWHDVPPGYWETP